MVVFFFSGKDSKTEVAPALAVALVPEEKVSFSLYGLSVSTLTVAKIRKVYNKLDSKAIAKQVRPSSDLHVFSPFKVSRLADIKMLTG